MSLRQSNIAQGGEDQNKVKQVNARSSKAFYDVGNDLSQQVSRKFKVQPVIENDQMQSQLLIEKDQRNQNGLQVDQGIRKSPVDQIQNRIVDESPEIEISQQLESGMLRFDISQGLLHNISIPVKLWLDSMDIDKNTFTWNAVVQLERFALSLLKDYISDSKNTSETKPGDSQENNPKNLLKNAWFKLPGTQEKLPWQRNFFNKDDSVQTQPQGSTSLRNELEQYVELHYISLWKISKLFLMIVSGFIAFALLTNQLRPCSYLLLLIFLMIQIEKIQLIKRKAISQVQQVCQLEPIVIVSSIDDQFIQGMTIIANKVLSQLSIFLFASFQGPEKDVICLDQQLVQMITLIELITMFNDKFDAIHSYLKMLELPGVESWNIVSFFFGIVLFAQLSTIQLAITICILMQSIKNQKFLQQQTIANLDQNISQKKIIKQNNWQVFELAGGLQEPVDQLSKCLENLNTKIQSKQVQPEQLNVLIEQCQASSKHVQSAVAYVIDQCQLQRLSLKLQLNDQDIEEIVKSSINLQVKLILENRISFKIRQGSIDRPTLSFPKVLRLDGFKMSQILTALIKSAVKNTKNDQIEITMLWRQDDKHISKPSPQEIINIELHTLTEVQLFELDNYKAGKRNKNHLSIEIEKAVSKSTNFGKPYVFKRIEENHKENDLPVITENSKEEQISERGNEKKLKSSKEEQPINNLTFSVAEKMSSQDYSSSLSFMRPGGNSNIERESKDVSMVISGISSVSNMSNFDDESSSQSIIFDSANVLNNNGVVVQENNHNSSGAHRQLIPQIYQLDNKNVVQSIELEQRQQPAEVPQPVVVPQHLIKCPVAAYDSNSRISELEEENDESSSFALSEDLEYINPTEFQSQLTKMSQVARNLLGEQENQKSNAAILATGKLQSGRRVFLDSNGQEEVIDESFMQRADISSQTIPASIVEAQSLQIIDQQIVQIEIQSSMGETGQPPLVHGQESSENVQINDQINRSQNESQHSNSSVVVREQIEEESKSLEKYKHNGKLYQQPSLIGNISSESMIMQNVQESNRGLQKQDLNRGKSAFGEYNYQSAQYSFAKAQENSSQNQHEFQQNNLSDDLKKLKIETFGQQQSLAQPYESAAEALSRFRQDIIRSKNQQDNTPGQVPNQFNRDDDSFSNPSSSNQQLNPRNQQQRRGSISNYMPKTIKVRHPIRARSKSITLPDFQAQESKNFPISRLNNYDPILKKHRGSIISMQSSLHSINEAEELKSVDSQEQKGKSNPDGKKVKVSNKAVNQQESVNSSDVSNSAKRISVKVQLQSSGEFTNKAPQINQITNFGHGRRNNLVKLAEQYKTRRSASVVVTDLSSHKEKLDEILNKHKKPAFQCKNESIRTENSEEGKEENPRLQDAPIPLPVVHQNINVGQKVNTQEATNNQSNSSSSDGPVKKSLFSQSYSFTAEVQKAIQQPVQSPFPAMNYRSRSSKPPMNPPIPTTLQLPVGQQSEYKLIYSNSNEQSKEFQFSNKPVNCNYSHLQNQKGALSTQECEEQKQIVFKGLLQVQEQNLNKSFSTLQEESSINEGSKLFKYSDDLMSFQNHSSKDVALGDLQLNLSNRDTRTKGWLIIQVVEPGNESLPNEKQVKRVGKSTISNESYIFKRQLELQDQISMAQSMGGDLTITLNGPKLATTILLIVPTEVPIQEQQSRRINIMKMGSELVQKQTQSSNSDWSQFAR